MTRTTRAAFCVLCLLCAASAASGRDIRQHRVDLSGGRAVIEGDLAGYETVDHVLALAPRTPLVVSLQSNHLASYFNLLAPGSTGEAFFIGSTQGNRFEGSVDGAGDYTVRVYLMRSAARRKERAHYRLEVAVGDAPGDYADGDAGGPDYWQVATRSPRGSVNLRGAPSTDAPILMRLRNGTVLRNLGCRRSPGARWCEVARPGAAADRGFIHGAYLREAPPPGSSDATVGDSGQHAVGNVPCGNGACPFGVVRSGGGSAVVTIQGTAGERVLHFRQGKPAMVEGVPAFEWSRSGDTSEIIFDGGERYHIPDAVIFGG